LTISSRTTKGATIAIVIMTVGEVLLAEVIQATQGMGEITTSITWILINIGHLMEYFRGHRLTPITLLVLIILLKGQVQIEMTGGLQIDRHLLRIMSLIEIQIKIEVHLIEEGQVDMAQPVHPKIHLHQEVEEAVEVAFLAVVEIQILSIGALHRILSVDLRLQNQRFGRQEQQSIICLGLALIRLVATPIEIPLTQHQGHQFLTEAQTMKMSFLNSMQLLLKILMVFKKLQKKIQCFPNHLAQAS